jgi:membrane protein DedA with SNARE-associated domain
VLFGRLIPTIRTVISIPAGTIGMGLSTFFIATVTGTILWNTALMFVGYILVDEYVAAAHYVDSIATLILLIVVLMYLIHVLRHIHRRMMR